MSKDIDFCQCFLERKAGNTSFETVSNIPENYAVVGNVLKLKNEDGTWTDGWIVRSVNASFSVDWRKAIKKHKENTGDSLPKNEVFN